MDSPPEIGHVEEISEIVETESGQTIVVAPEVRVINTANRTGKVVFVQTPEGITRAVRIQGSASTSSVASVKTEPGYIQVAKSSPTVVQRVVSSQSGNNVIIKGGSSGKTYALANSPKVQPTVTKTITMAQAQQMGLLSKTGGGAPPTGTKLVARNPTVQVRAGPSTPQSTAPRVIKVSATGQLLKAKPVAADSPRVVQISPGQQSSRVVVATRPTIAKVPKAEPTIQYVEVVPSGGEMEYEDEEEEMEMHTEEEEETVTIVPQPKVQQQRMRTTIQQRVVVPTTVMKTEEPKVKVTSQTADRLLNLEGSVVIADQQSKYVMLPQDYINQLETATIEEEQQILQQQQQEEQEEELEETEVVYEANPVLTDILDVTKKRPCNCTKSQCLKLYCECFANGEFCSNCNCRDCFNNMEYEEERQNAIYSCLERNPNAFRPKVGKTNNAEDVVRHHKGCHCKRSGCLKNYCECFEARIPCSEICKCVGCKNCDEHVLSATPRPGKGVSAIKRSVAAAVDDLLRIKPTEDDEPPPKQPFNFMTADVVDATVQCMMAQADECQQNGVSTKNTERLILEEFGRCLAEIIDFSNKNADD